METLNDKMLSTESLIQLEFRFPQKGCSYCGCYHNSIREAALCKDRTMRVMTEGAVPLKRSK